MPCAIIVGVKESLISFCLLTIVIKIEENIVSRVMTKVSQLVNGEPLQPEVF